MGSCCGQKTKKEPSKNLPNRSREFQLFIESQEPFQDHYVVIKKIGEGATSHVKLVECKYTKVLRAIKTLSTSSERNLKKAVEEVKLLQTIDHPTLIRSVESFQENSSIHIVSEFYSGHSLYDLIHNEQKVTEQRALTLMYYILSGISYLHKHRIMHRDIKPENLIFESDDPDSLLKIIDFGTAKKVEKKIYRKKKGTVLYMSPEVIDGNYTEKCDIWSAGIIFCILLTGTHPFYCESEQDMMEKIKRLPLQFKGSKWEGVSSQTKKIIQNMLEKKEANRSSAHELLQNKCFNNKFVLQTKEIQSISQKSIGFIVKNKVQKLLLNIGIIKVLESKKLSKAFLYLDQDCDGKINSKDFAGEHLEKNHYCLSFTDFLIKNTDWEEILTSDILARLFEFLDTNGDREISIKDFSRYESFGGQEIDKEEDVRIGIEEFQSLFRSKKNY